MEDYVSIATSLLLLMLLLHSGNVELNPGPMNCKNPNCLDETVPITLKMCTCGYVFWELHEEGGVNISTCNEHNYALIQQFEEFT